MRKLAELYGLQDELLGSTFPVVAITEYPKEMLDNLEKVIKECKPHSENYSQNKSEFDKLRDALKPVMEIRDDALDLPRIDISKVPENTTVKLAKLDFRAEVLMKMCFDKQSEVINWDSK